MYVVIVMLLLGSHVGFSKNDQLLGSLKEALGYGANTFMFYTGAPQNTRRYPIEDGLTLEALSIMKDEGIDYSKVVVHAPYIVNLDIRDNHLPWTESPYVSQRECGNLYRVCRG